MKTIEEIKKENCNLLIPTKWNIYEWAEKHPKTTIAASLKRLEKIFDFSDSVQIGNSGGKDSTVTANLACLELNLRRLRVANGIMRDGTPGIDPLDKKWMGKRIHSCSTNAEVVFSDTNNYIRRFLAKYGPEGFNLVEHNEICFPMSWQSGCSFDSGILISWDPDKQSQWVQPMPTKEDLHGFDCINFDDRNTANAVALNSLKPEAQEYHRTNNNVFMCKEKDLFGNKDNNSDNEVEAVANFGRGPILPNLKKACHEKEEQDDYSYMFSQTSWLLDNRSKEDIEACNNRLKELYDTSKDVWFLVPNKVEDESSHSTNYINKNKFPIPKEFKETTISTALISLRAEESLDRRVILSQGEYSTGQYSNNQGTNICSPVFDFSTADIWRLLSATDWDVNDVYEKLYEIGIGIGDQRVGSLLNYAAVRQIGTVKALEPDLYGRINGRFQNVEFMSQFSKAGYFKIGKPKDTFFDGHNHIKAGYEPEEIKALSDRYEDLLIKLEIPYRREGNEFWSTDPKYKSKPWFPLQNYIKEHPEMFI